MVYKATNSNGKKKNKMNKQIKKKSLVCIFLLHNVTFVPKQNDYYI